MNGELIIIPTYNEKANISLLIEEIFKVRPQVSVMVVDDNSPDGTGKVVQSLIEKFRNLSLLTRQKKEGLGKAYIQAFEKALLDSRFTSVLMMDADFSHHPRYLEAIFNKGKTHDVVVGSRYVSGGRTEGWELWRRALSRGGNLYCRFITRMPVSDCTGGFNLIHTNILRKVELSHLDMSGYAFIMELKYVLYKVGARFCEVPIIFQNRTGGESKINNHIISEGVLAPWKMILK